MEDFARLLRRFDRVRGVPRSKAEQRQVRRLFATFDHRARGKMRARLQLRIALG